MAYKHLKTSAMAAIVLGCALGVAHAAGSSPPPIDPSQLRTVLKLKPGEPLPQMGGGRLTPGPTFNAGWHSELCLESFYNTDGSSFTIFAVNTDNTFFFDSNVHNIRTPAQEILLAACQNAGPYYVHTIIPDSFSFDGILVVPLH